MPQLQTVDPSAIDTKCCPRVVDRLSSAGVVCRTSGYWNMLTNEWLNHTANAIQAIEGLMWLCDDTEELRYLWDRFIEPRTPYETLLLRGLVVVALGHISRAPEMKRNVNALAECFVGADSTPILTLKRAAESFVRARQSGRKTLSSEIKEFVDLHYRDFITAKSVGLSFHVTARVVQGAIKDTTGQSFKKYLIARREQAALELVRAGMKVDAAALAVGYRAKGALYRNCKRSSGLSPAARVRK